MFRKELFFTTNSFNISLDSDDSNCSRSAQSLTSVSLTPLSLLSLSIVLMILFASFLPLLLIPIEALDIFLSMCNDISFSNLSNTTQIV